LNIINSELESVVDNREKIFGEVMLTKDGDAIVDMLTKYAEILIKENGKDLRIIYTIPSELPELEKEDDYKKRISTYVNNQGGGRDYDDENTSYQKRQGGGGGGRSYNDYLKSKSQRERGGGRSRGGNRWDQGSRGGRSNYM